MDGDCSHEIKRRLFSGRKAVINLDSILKSRDSTLPTKACLVKAMVFPIVMYGCESWTIKKAERRRIDAFELWCWRRPESSLDCKEIKRVNPKRSQPWIFIRKTDAEALIHWPPDAKNWLIGKDPDAGKDWRQEEKGTTEDEMAGWHHQPDRHEFEQAPGAGDGQGGLAGCGYRVTKCQTGLSDRTRTTEHSIQKRRYSVFSSAHGTFARGTLSRTDHTLNQKASLVNLRRVKS